jgi:predicted RecA/RadA family phage recombinase
MAGMLLQGGARALVGTGLAAQPPLTSQPAAATSAQTAAGIAFGPQATPVGQSSGASAWLHPGGHQVALAGAAALIFMVWLYRSLPA